MLDFKTLYQFEDVGLLELERVIQKMRTLIPQNSIVLLEGDLGAGKTTFVSAFLKALKAEDLASSPTFALHNQYSTAEGIVDHFDLYRIESEEELESTGFWETINSENLVTFIEWPSRLETQFLPQFKELFKVSLMKTPGDRRKVTVLGHQRLESYL